MRITRKLKVTKKIINRVRENSRNAACVHNLEKALKPFEHAMQQREVAYYREQFEKELADIQRIFHISGFDDLVARRLVQMRKTEVESGKKYSSKSFKHKYFGGCLERLKFDLECFLKSPVSLPTIEQPVSFKGMI